MQRVCHVVQILDKSSNYRIIKRIVIKITIADGPLKMDVNESLPVLAGSFVGSGGLGASPG